MEGGAGLRDAFMFFLGFFMAGLIGKVLTSRRAARNMMLGPGRPMSVQTKETAADVYRKAGQGRRRYWLLTVLLVLLLLFTCILVSQMAMGCSLI
ncbi:MAG: hypothetical protein JXA74_13115 [Anaerolineae bacterium]|nr:hypothetical protein [Anaerolineae bacterium]